MFSLIAQVAPPVEPQPVAPRPMDVENMGAWKQVFVDSFQEAFYQVATWLPNLLVMLVLLVVGYVISRLLGGITRAGSEALGVQAAAERSGLAASMQQVGIDRRVSSILGQIVFWMTMSVFLAAAFNTLGLETVSIAIENVVAYIPRLLVAAVVIIIGLLVAAFLRGVVATSAVRVGITYAETLAAACYWVLAALTFIAAFDQLGIRFELLGELVLIAFASVALGLGLAVGLGGREVMAGILAGYYTRQRLQPGDQVHVAGLHGTVREVGPVATIIETEEGGLLNRHSIPNVKMLTDAVR